MSQLFDAGTWTVAIPVEWTIEDEDDCIRFAADPPVGELRISAYGKEGPVTHEDLEQLAAEHLARGATPEPIEHPEFEGFGLAFEVDEFVETAWFVRHGAQLLFVTYTCPTDQHGEEDEVIEEILATLTPLGFDPEDLEEAEDFEDFEDDGDA